MHVCMLMVDWSLSALYKCPCILWFPLAFRIKKTWKTKTRISFFPDLNKVVISLLYLYGLFYYLYPCPHPCPCSGSLYNQMLWTHDFDHMSLIYDIVTTFFVLQTTKNHKPFSSFNHFNYSLLLCATFVTVGYYLFVRVWSSLRIDIVFFQRGVLYISHSDTIPSPWIISFTNTTRTFRGVGSPSPPTPADRIAAE